MTDTRSDIYFISDLHLGASYIRNRRAHEAAVCAFLESIRHSAAELYLLGDILDYWYEYRTVVPRGYVRFFGKLAELSDEGVRITWLIGNHDIWIYDYLPTELGITVIDGSIVRDLRGKRFYMAHGDALGSLKPGFRFIRSMFRNRFCQKLYAAIHPRWTIPFAHRWSSHSRQGDSAYAEYLGDDREPFMQFAREYAAGHPDVDYIILGHRHLMFRRHVSEHTEVIVLGDWIDKHTYCRWDGQQLLLTTFDCNLPAKS